MGGRIIVESVAGCLWNRWPDGRGIRILHFNFYVLVLHQLGLKVDFYFVSHDTFPWDIVI